MLEHLKCIQKKSQYPKNYTCCDKIYSNIYLFFLGRKHMYLLHEILHRTIILGVAIGMFCLSCASLFEKYLQGHEMQVIR